MARRLGFDSLRDAPVNFLKEDVLDFIVIEGDWEDRRHLECSGEVLSTTVPSAE